MPSLTTGINIALQALLSHSQAIEVIEHNVANANTVGYHRQSAVLSATVPSQSAGLDFSTGAGMRGTGVTIDSIKRFNLEFFDGRYRGINADAKKSEMERDVMVQLESTLAETGDDGMLAHLDRFWNGWQQVSADPTNTSLRAAVLDDAGALANAFNRRAQQLMQLRSDQDQAIISRVEEINDLASRVAEMNGEISRVLSLGEQPNDLLDQRDRFLDRLSETAGAVSYVQKNGEVIVSIGGHMLVTGHDTLKLTYAADDANSGLVAVSWEDGQPLSAPSGEIQGLLNARDEIIPRQQAAQNQMAQALITSLNTAHSAGYGLDGSHGLSFFEGTSALNIRVNPNLSAQSLAVSSANGETSNNEVALAIAALKDSTLMGGGTQTIHQFYNAEVTSLGMDLNRANDSVSHLGSVSTALAQQRESVIGVNLDEEAANLVKFQKAYQAAARIMTVFDEMLDRIINGMGVSGR